MAGCALGHETAREGVSGEFPGEEGGRRNGVCVAARAGPAGFVKEEEAQDRDDAFEGDVVPELDGPGGGFHNEAGECACCDSAEEDAAGIDDEAFAAAVEENVSTMIFEPTVRK